MATIPTAYTWTVGELVTASKMNSFLRDAVSFLLARPSARLTHSTTQSIPDSVNTAVTFNTEGSDTDNGHSTVTNASRYTVQTAGTWSIDTCSPWVANATGKRELFIRSNGASDFASSAIVASASVRHALQVSDKIALSVGDYVEAVVWQSSGVALNLDNTFHGGQRMALIWERT
jgi:hypothetical protein